MRFKLQDLRNVFLITLLAFIFLKGAFDFFDLEEFFQSFPHPSLIFISFYLIQNLILLIPLYFFTFYKYRVRFSDFGFRKISWKKLVKLPLQGYFFYLGWNLIITQITYSYPTVEIPGYERAEPILPLFGEDVLGLSLAILIIILIAPLVEEMFFRGFVLQILAGKYRAFWGSLAAALIFALLHLEFGSIVPLFVLGLILNWLFLKSRSLWPGIIFHLANNTIALFLEYAFLHEWIPTDFPEAFLKLATLFSFQ